MSEESQQYPFAEAGITSEQYRNIGLSLQWKQPETVQADLLLSVSHESPGKPVQVMIKTDEFTTVCPWTGLPDTGSLMVAYTPRHKVLELKALKYYLLSYRDVGIIQEDAANRIMADLVRCCLPLEMTVSLDYMVRGGLQTVVTADYKFGDFGEDWENEDWS